MFVAHQIGQKAMSLTHALFRAFLAYLDSDGQRIDEEADASFHALSALHASEKHRAEHHVLAPRKKMQHFRPSGVAKACCADAEPSRVPAQTVRKLLIDFQVGFRDIAAVALDVR